MHFKCQMKTFYTVFVPCFFFFKETIFPHNYIDSFLTLSGIWGARRLEGDEWHMGFAMTTKTPDLDAL